jgi:nicotinate phosphoribosyltransferase
MTTTTQIINEVKETLPKSHEPYTDKYFLRTGEILRAENLNPWVRAQVFIRKGPGKAYGIDEAIAILERYGNLADVGARVYALNEGDKYGPKETLMLIEAPIQNIVELETMYLGVLSGETTLKNGDPDINLDAIKLKAQEVTKAAGLRPVLYFGARHWRYDKDAEIAKAAFEGGLTAAATDIGAELIGQKGQGTTPHVLENIMAWKYGYENAVPETMKAFDRVIDPNVPRIILADYRNHEIDDSLATARALGNRLNGIRIDTCGENVGQGALKYNDPKKLEELVGKKVIIPTEDEKYWFGTGVTITGVYAVNKALKENGFNYVRTTLSSGFANHKKVEAFTRAEEILGVKLYDALGVGQLFKSRAAKMDIVAVGETLETMIPISKVGRGYNPNPRLNLRLAKNMKGGSA